MGKTFRGENHRLVREARKHKRQGFVFRSTEVKKPKYEIWLKVEDREDVDDDWNITRKLIYKAKNFDEAMDFIHTHQYLETELEPNDDGSSWLHIQTLYHVKIA